MKYIITESQLNRVIPLSIRRRLGEIDDALYEMLYNTDIGEAVMDYDREDYIVYVMEYLYDEYFLNLKTSGGEFEALTNLFGNRIGEFWDNHHEETTLMEQRVKGNEVTPGKYVAHTSNPMNRKSIMNSGIKTTLDMLMTEYMDNFLASKEVSYGYDVLLIYDELGEDYLYDEEVSIDYTYDNSYMSIRMDLINMFSSMFSRDIEQTKEFIKNWFENKFNLKVEYVNTFEVPNLY